MVFMWFCCFIGLFVPLCMVLFSYFLVWDYVVLLAGYLRLTMSSQGRRSADGLVIGSQLVFVCCLGDIASLTLCCLEKEGAGSRNVGGKKELGEMMLGPYLVPTRMLKLATDMRTNEYIVRIWISHDFPIQTYHKDGNERPKNERCLNGKGIYVRRFSKRTMTCWCGMDTAKRFSFVYLWCINFKIRSKQQRGYSCLFRRTLQQPTKTFMVFQPWSVSITRYYEQCRRPLLGSLDFFEKNEFWWEDIPDMPEGQIVGPGIGGWNQAPSFFPALFADQMRTLPPLEARLGGKTTVSPTYSPHDGLMSVCWLAQWFLHMKSPAGETASMRPGLPDRYLRLLSEPGAAVQAPEPRLSKAWIVAPARLLVLS